MEQEGSLIINNYKLINYFSAFKQYFNIVFKYKKNTPSTSYSIVQCLWSRQPYTEIMFYIRQNLNLCTSYTLIIIIYTEYLKSIWMALYFPTISCWATKLRSSMVYNIHSFLNQLSFLTMTTSGWLCARCPREIFKKSIDRVVPQIPNIVALIGHHLCVGETFDVRFAALCSPKILL